MAQCDMVFFPECFSFLGESQRESVATAQELTGPLLQRYAALARRVNC